MPKRKKSRSATTFPRSSKWKADAFAGTLGKLKGLGGLAAMVKFHPSKLRPMSCEALASDQRSGVCIKIRRWPSQRLAYGLASYAPSTRTLLIGLPPGMAVFLDTEGRLRVGMRIA